MGSFRVKLASILLGMTLIQTVLMKSFWAEVQFLIFFADRGTLNFW